MLKHVAWKVGGVGGRIAVLYNEDRKYLVIKPIGGNHPPAGLLFSLLDATIYRWREKITEAFQSGRYRDYPWGVEVRESRFGGVTYLTKRLINEELFHVRVTARLHVTSQGKFHEIEGPLSELAPILERVKPFQFVLQMQDDYETWEGVNEHGELVWLAVMRLAEEFDNFHSPRLIPDLDPAEEPVAQENQILQSQVPVIEIV